jgi:AcrR family transcriptional regulator
MLRSGQRQGDQLREGNALLGQSQAGNQGKTAAKQLGVGQEVWFFQCRRGRLDESDRFERGAFYNHFSSKDELFASIVERELRQSLERLGADQDRDKLERCLKHYLSMSHVDHPETGCALPVLGAEIARSDVVIRQQAEHWICQLQESWAQVLESDSLAWAILSQCIGALVVARMLVTPELQRRVLKSSYDETSRQIASPRA